MSLTEAEARHYYDLHKEDFADPATVTLREILVDVPASRQGNEAGVNVAQDDEAAKRAADLRARVAAGEDFGKLASQESSAPSKANGGLIGPINFAELSPTLQQMLQKMKPGEMTQPLRTARGYQILKLETFKAAATQPFESVRDLVADKISEQRQQTEVRRFMSRVRSQAIIEWKNDELKKLYDKQVAALDATGGQ
jgi:parvulin-like peptidyl-prolyl isomerase